VDFEGLHPINIHCNNKNKLSTDGASFLPPFPKEKQVGKQEKFIGGGFFHAPSKRKVNLAE